MAQAILYTFLKLLCPWQASLLKYLFSHHCTTKYTSSKIAISHLISSKDRATFMLRIYDGILCL